MRILIAEDEPISRRVLIAALTEWNYEVEVTSTGLDAWSALEKRDAPPVAILDINMPGLSGIEVCRNVRATGRIFPPYIILVTAESAREQMVAGLGAGANDYVVKPFYREELRARLGAGVRMIETERTLADKVKELETALSQVRKLEGMLPICSYCKSIRNDDNYWQRLESYITENSQARFSHGICPECYENVVNPKLAEIRARR